MSDFELTKQEKSAIRTLKRLEKRWPKSLWLFSAGGSLIVMRKNSDGERAGVINKDGKMTGQGADSNYEVEHINIENDGGDF